MLIRAFTTGRDALRSPTLQLAWNGQISYAIDQWAISKPTEFDTFVIDPVCQVLQRGLQPKDDSQSGFDCTWQDMVATRYQRIFKGADPKIVFAKAKPISRVTHRVSSENTLRVSGGEHISHQHFSVALMCQLSTLVNSIEGDSRFKLLSNWREGQDIAQTFAKFHDHVQTGNAPKPANEKSQSLNLA